jgi:hypothetical protein
VSTSVAYEPFVLPAPPLETFVERVPSDVKLPTHLSRWKQLQREGWDVTALIAPDSKSVIALGCRGTDLTIRVRKQPHPANQRLMDSLGVAVLFDPDAPEKCPCGCSTGHYKQ